MLNVNQTMLDALKEAVIPLERLGDFVGNIDKGGASGLGSFDRCAILLQVRNAIASADSALLSNAASSNMEMFPGATREEIASVMMQDLVGEYEASDDVPEWKWVESVASFAHQRNGEDGIWEFVLNLSCIFEDVPAKLKATIEQAKRSHMAYLIIHQGT